ncbi:MAG: hypothetical protein OWS74_01100, partial [Firmicutes bacterium]|nr:hypothetical protein [Bacillota bacterium]
ETVHPIADVIGLDAQDKPLAHWQKSSALIVIPEQLPAWARQALATHVSLQHWLKGNRPFIWNGHSEFFAQAVKWHCAGLHAVQVNGLQEASGFSTAEEKIVAAAARIPSQTHTVHWSAQGFVPTVKTVRTTLQPALSQLLGHSLKQAGSILVVNGQGQIAAAASYPKKSGEAWQPTPAGLSLQPVLLAAALQDGQLVHALKGTPDSQALAQLAKDWGDRHIARAAQQLGIGQADAVVGQQIADTSLPSSATTWMTSADNALWVTPAEVARAYLRSGIASHAVGQLTLLDHVDSKRHAQKSSPKSSVLTLRNDLPQVQVNGWTFSVWKAPHSPAVAFTAQDGGWVMVLQGAAVRSTIDIVHQFAVGMGQHSPTTH